jgi:outer membrane protein TolC
MGRFKSLLLILFILGWLGEGISSLAQEEAAGETFKFSLEEATALALKNNFDIQLARYDAWIARTDEGAAESIYDTIFNAEIEYQNNQRKQTSTIAGTRVLDNDYNVGLSRKLPTGTTLEVNAANNRHWSNAAFATSALTHDATAGLTVKQELGKNFFGVQDRGDIKITRLDIANSEYTSLEKIEESIASVQKAYWDLALEGERARIAEEMVGQAKRLFDLHQEKSKDGLVEPPEMMASQANYETRKNELLLARNAVDTRGNVLKLLLNITADDARLEPSEGLSLPGEAVAFTASLKEAFTARRDYQKALNEIQSKDLTLSLKRNNLWPEVNLTATFERNGLGDHFKQAVRQIGEEDNPNLFAGLEITFPLENTGARAELKAADLEKARALVNLKLVEKKIAVEISDQVRHCNVYRELARSRRGIAQLQRQKLDEEEKRFRYGRSDTDTMIRFQEDWLKAREAELEAKHLYQTALVDLAVKEGTLLDKYWEGKL